MLYIEEDKKKKLPETELATVLSVGSAIDVNYILHKNGNKVWSTGESIFVKSADNETFIIKLILDINKQKLLENVLKESNKNLERANKDLDNFVYTASHDLKAPINNLEGLLNMLYKNVPEEAKEFAILNIEAIDKAITRSYHHTLSTNSR